MLTRFASRFLEILTRETSSRRRPQRRLLSSIATIEALEPRKMLTGAGLIIVPTFDPATVGNLPNHAAIENTINQVIALYESSFSDKITVNITFQGSTDPNDLGSSVAPRDSVPYTQFLTALKASKSTADDATALSSLPNTATEPVQHGDNVGISTANEKALGGIAANAPGVDGTITINYSSTNIDRINVDPNNYDLAATVAHEMDEVLGLGSNMPDPGDTWVQDLFRYAANGQRSYTTSTTAQSFFSLDGKTDLLPFNQTGAGADYGDWASGPVAHVQDAFGNTGQDGIVNPSIEFRALDILGYHFVTQGPSGTSKTVTTATNTPYAFKTADFGYTDPNHTPPNTLTAVKITTLPAAGSLKDNGAAVTVGKLVPVADITGGKLIFTPATGASGAAYATFKFQVKDNGSTANGGVNLDPNPKTMTINVTGVATVNHAPSGTSGTVTAFANVDDILKVADFGFSDPNDNPPNTLQAVKFTLLPGAGTLSDNGVNLTVNQFVSVADINGGLLTFTPNQDLLGPKFFLAKFQVQDNGGTAAGGVNLDPTAKNLYVRIGIPNSAPTGTSTTVIGKRNLTYTLKTSDFGFSDPNDSPSNVLLAVKITLLSGAGTLLDNGVAVTANQFISAADINNGKLVFKPTTNLAGGPFFLCKFQVQDNGGTAGGGVDLDPTAKVLDIRLNG